MTIGSFVTGALVGFGAALILQQTDHLPDLDELTRQVQSSASSDPAQPSKPRYEFYEMLAKAEVRVPVLDALKGGSGGSDAVYLLQAGSFRAAEDAERLRVNLLLLGFDVETHPVDLDGSD